MASQRKDVNRRQFLATGAAATAAMMARGSLAQEAARPTVAVVRDRTRQSIDGFNVNAEIVQRLVDRAVMAVAGADDVAQAWRRFVQPGQKVAVKFNGLFRNATTHPEVVTAVTNGLVRAGINGADITVYDRSDRDFRTARIQLSRQGPGPRRYATGRDYGPEVHAGSVRTRLSNILLRADALINVPMMKTHVRSCITGCLKNHLGTVHNAGAFHQDFCSALADLNALAPIKDKTRLCVVDALYALYHGGPGYSPRHRWDYHGIVAGVDPLAVDTVLAAIIRAKRREENLEPPDFRPLRHLERAAQLGVGEASPERIRRLDIEI